MKARWMLSLTGSAIMLAGLATLLTSGGCRQGCNCHGGSRPASYAGPTYATPQYPGSTAGPAYAQPTYAAPSGSGARSAPTYSAPSSGSGMFEGSGSR